MMVPLTVDVWRCSLLYFFLLECFLSISLSITHEEIKQALNATVKLKGSERNNRTHRPHTYICMLSRVAAVTAPRTHNRRRVTGSSGRRREGRESERQRPNMSRHHFYSAVLLLLVVMVMCHSIGGAAKAAEQKEACPGSSSGKYFVWKDKEEGNAVGLLYGPSLFEMNGAVFAVAGAQGTKNGNRFTGIASELLMSSNENPKQELDTKQLKTQVLEECSSDEGNCPSPVAAEAGPQSQTKVLLSRPTTVVNGSNIYMLAGVYVNKNLASCQGVVDAKSYELLLVKGNVSVEGNKNRVYWNDTYVIPWNPDDEQPKKLLGLMGGGGSGVRMEDGTLVFPLEGKNTKNGDTENGGKIAMFRCLYTP
ncbi:trans-sialidase, putative [Trypanosoma cruzi marinkellei]|uniref:Trans-sialidase, putative n=1 Tax=Trypanosoma cruzi marinkellei TaxID=85056 RepID=K2N426_TRYCR|nr:trans-sialidase, putative [Trypanosoma cruzi marinkellei]